MRMTKRSFAVLLAAALMLALIPMPVSAAVDDVLMIDGIQYCVLSESDAIGTVEVIQKVLYNDYSGNITIPETVESDGVTYTVTSIGHFAFWDCAGLTSISLPDSVTSIAEGAFFWCRGLKNINIPIGVTSIKNLTFSDCIGLESISLPDGVTTIEFHAFAGCSELTSISLPDSVTSIEESAFYGCSKLESISIPAGVTSISPYTFNECRKLTSISLPAGVTSIGNNAFIWCSGLTSISLPDGVTSIGDYAFYGCEGLTGLSLPVGVTSIGDYAFSGCSGLTSLSIPAGVTSASIGDSAFYWCIGLESISIPAGITTIKNGAFQGCFGLTNISFSGDTPPLFGSDLFYLVPDGLQVRVPHGTVPAYTAALAGKLPDNSTIEEEDAVITITAIPGVTAPVKGAPPVTTVTGTEQYTGSIVWDPADHPFAAGTVYTATITLTPNPGYTLTGVAANSFTVAGATAVSNPVNAGVITAVFPATEAPPTVTNVTVSPDTIEVQKGAAQQFTATVSGTNNPSQAVAWSVNGNSSASTVISSGGLLTVGADETAETLTVTATSAVDGTKSGTASVTVTEAPPAPSYGISLNHGGTFTFPSAATGYGEQTAESVTVLNTGNRATGALTIGLSGDTAAFALSKESISDINVSGTDSFTVKPITGLGAGTYTATVTVSGGSMTPQTFDVSFTVNAAPTTYTVTLNQAAGGTATASHTGAAAGTTVALGISSLSDSYSFVRWDILPSVTWTSGSAYNQSAAFTMPNENVTIMPVYQNNGGAPAQDASIAPVAAAFDKNASSANYRDIAVTMDPGSYTLLSVKYGSTALTAGTQYTVNGNVYTFKKEYLATLGMGARAFTFDISGGADPVLTVTVTDSTGSGSDDYIPRSLTDSATGIMVSGSGIYRNAQLAVKPLTLHTDAACDAIREAQANGQLILGFDISLSRGFIPPLTISIPVDSRYNGRSVTILHCVNGRPETIIATVVNGMATFTVTELSPFAVTTGLPVPDEITGIPKTGDAATPWGFVLTGLAAACGGYVVMKWRRV